MSNRDWYRFFEDVHTRTPIDLLGPCAGGPRCGETEEDRWHCCGAAIDHDNKERILFPYENDWLRSNADRFPQIKKGCSGCGFRKTILCALWPVVPIVTGDGQAMVGLQVSCEAFAMVPEFYKPHCFIAEQVASIVVNEIPLLIGQMIQMQAWLNDGPHGIELRMRAVLAAKMLSDPNFKNIVATMLAMNETENLCDEVRRLPMFMGV